MRKLWRTKIAIPAGNTINRLCSAAKVSTQVAIFGRPPRPLTQDCSNGNLAPGLSGKIVTEDVGPFRATGHKQFLSVLRTVFTEYKGKYPEQYADLSYHGCLCVRLVRGSISQPSNHCWGTAIDLGFGGVVDSYGDGLCYKGLLDLYSIAKTHGLYWGAGFGREDAMHLEASDELLREWKAKGLA